MDIVVIGLVGLAGAASLIIGLFVFLDSLFTRSKGRKITRAQRASMLISLLIFAASIWGLFKIGPATPDEVAAVQARDAEIVRQIEEQGFSVGYFDGYVEKALNYITVSLNGDCDLSVNLRYEDGEVTLTRTNNEGVTVDVTPDKLARWCNL